MQLGLYGKGSFHDADTLVIISLEEGVPGLNREGEPPQPGGRGRVDAWRLPAFSCHGQMRQNTGNGSTQHLNSLH